MAWYRSPKIRKFLRLALPVVLLGIISVACYPYPGAGRAAAGADRFIAPVSDTSETGTVRVAYKKRNHPAPSATPTPSDEPAPAPSSDPTPPPSSAPSDVTVNASNAWTATISWPTSGATTAAVYRDGVLLDQGPASVGHLTDRLLWPNKSFTFRVKLLDANGNAVFDQSVTKTMPSASGSVQRLYSSNSFFNTPISSSPAIDPGSSAMVQKSFVNYADSANFANTPAWGMPLAYATELSKSYNVGCVKFDCGSSVSGKIPAYAHQTTGGDGHLAVVDPAANTELDMWQAAPSWSAGSRYTLNAEGVGGQTQVGANAATATGFAIMGGIVRPEEIAQGHIDHALTLTTPYVRSGYVAWPATRTDGDTNDSQAVPEGARLQLDPSFNVDAQSWPAWMKVMAKALQTYGAYVSDFGGSVAIRGEAQTSRGYDAWSLLGTGTGLQQLPWSKFRVLKLQQQ